MDIEILCDGNEIGSKIGEPVQLTEYLKNKPEGSRTNNVAPTSNEKPGPSYGVSTDVSNQLNSSLADARIISPISSLSPYHNKWIIKARVTNKSTIRSWSNSRGEGRLFSMDLIDESGEIRCTAFREMVDKFYDLIEVDKVYFITKCQLKQANKQFCNLKNEYEMTMTNETVVEECFADDGHVPKQSYNFTPIEKLKDAEVGKVVGKES